MNDIYITAYGATNYVGRSAFLLYDRDHRILLDCGLQLIPKKPTVAPEGVNSVAKKLDAVVLSHAHFDHSGYLPRLVREGYKGQFFMTKPTRDVAYYLWLDHLKIEGNRHWSEADLDEMYRRIVTVNYHKKIKLADGISAQFLNAGHIIGASQILIDWEGTLILYSGDINDRITPLFDGYETPPDDDIELLITESTNGNRYVPERAHVDVGFRMLAKQIAEAGNKFILPSFAVGRSQELLITLALDPSLDHIPIYVDGMIDVMNQVTEAYLSKRWVSERFFDQLREQGLRSPFDKENIISIRESSTNPHKLRRLISTSNNGAIIVTTSGMMEGGPIHTYLDYCASKEENVIGITGYQVEGTTGREVADGEREITIYGHHTKSKKIQIKAKVMKFPYSGHSSVEGLKKYMELAQARKVVMVHGEERNQEYIRNFVRGVANPNILKEGLPTLLIRA